MSRYMSGLLFFVSFAYMGTQAVRRWGDCLIYTPDELKDPQVYPKPGYDDSDCVTYVPSTDRLCKWYKCPKLTCKKEDQVAPSGWLNKNCHICKGTCYSAGKLYEAGTSFTASNNAATCGCIGTGSPWCNELGANDVLFCNATGNCYSAGKLYEAGASFTASNNAATCGCTGTGSAWCNALGASDVLFCNATGPYPSL